MCILCRMHIHVVCNTLKFLWFFFLMCLYQCMNYNSIKNISWFYNWNRIFNESLSGKFRNLWCCQFKRRIRLYKILFILYHLQYIHKNSATIFINFLHSNSASLADTLYLNDRKKCHHRREFLIHIKVKLQNNWYTWHWDQVKTRFSSRLWNFHQRSRYLV